MKCGIKRPDMREQPYQKPKTECLQKRRSPYKTFEIKIYIATFIIHHKFGNEQSYLNFAPKIPTKYVQIIFAILE
jgi:hypothetical protein